MSKREELEEVVGYVDSHDMLSEIEAAERYDEPPAEDPMITTSLRLPRSVMQEVRAVAEAEGMKPTAQMRRWIEERLRAPAPSRGVPLSAVEQMLHAVVREELRDAGLRAS
jgi:hypothetical protein